MDFQTKVLALLCRDGYANENYERLPVLQAYINNNISSEVIETEPFLQAIKNGNIEYPADVMEVVNDLFLQQHPEVFAEHTRILGEK